MRKTIIIVLIAGLVGYVAYRYITDVAKTRADTRGRRNIVAVETAKIKRADLGDRVVFTGTIKAEERYDAAPKISGIIKEVNFNVGDTVTRGDVLAILDDDEHKLEVEQAEASLLVAQANANDAEKQLEIARRDFERSVNLRRENVISAQEHDRADATFKAAQAKYETAVANVKLSEALLRSAKVRLGYTKVLADWAGGHDRRVIGQRYMDAGGLVAANMPILSVLDINTVRAVIAVSEKEYPKMALGDTVRVSTAAFPGKIFEGRVARIPQELGELTREAEVEVAINNRSLELKPGMFIRADIEFARRDGAAAAPIEAVVRRDDGSRGVYVVNESRNQVSFMPVTEGIVDGKLVELVDGNSLLDSEVVVLGQHLLKDGISVRVAGDLAAGEPAA
ncbi:MAG: efflux RND transporter periplasmic adaptor subunit [Planctomycetes bacterium]|nr:efflux RND transporter periplasmic adaptor subunit [Planctomycetota bacterium]